MSALNELVAAGDRADDLRWIAGRTITVGDHFALEAPALRSLPSEAFDSTLLLRPRVDTKSRVCVRQCFYSVPVGHVGQRIDVRLGAETVEAFDGARLVASHPRLVAKMTESLVLDHYLEVLAIKPGAMLGATALVRARASRVLALVRRQVHTVVREYKRFELMANVIHHRGPLLILARLRHLGCLLGWRFFSRARRISIVDDREDRLVISAQAWSPRWARYCTSHDRIC